MREFFMGLRRKVGMLTLAIACIFMTGWVRSLSATDVIMIHTGKNMPKAWRLRAGWLRSQQGQIQRIESIAVGKQGRPVGPSGVYRWQLPYWSIVVPLTLISLWLLLSKSGKSPPKKIAEPNSNEGP